MFSENLLWSYGRKSMISHQVPSSLLLYSSTTESLLSAKSATNHFFPNGLFGLRSKNCKKSTLSTQERLCGMLENGSIRYLCK